MNINTEYRLDIQNTEDTPGKSSDKEVGKNSIDDINSIPNEAISKFLPEDFPRSYQDGRIPLRVQIFNDKKILHSVISKPKKGVYMCNHCNTSFANFGTILDHFDEYDIQRPFKCNIDDCPWKIVGFNKARQLQRHSASVHSEREFRCEVHGCERMFKRMDLLTRHTKSVHENLSSRFNKKLGKTSCSSSASSSPLINPKELDVFIKPLIQKSHSTSSITPVNLENTNREDLIPNYTSQSIKSTIPSSSKRTASSSRKSQTKKPKYGDSYKHSINFLTNHDDE